MRAAIGQVENDAVGRLDFAETLSLVSGLCAALVVALGLGSKRRVGRVRRGGLGGVVAVLVEAGFEFCHASAQFQDNLDQSVLVQGGELLTREHDGYTIPSGPKGTNGTEQLPSPRGRSPNKPAWHA